MTAFVHDPGPELPLLPAMVASFALGTLITAFVIYLRRLANVARWGKFVGRHS